MCSSGGQVASNDQALQDASVASNKALAADYGTTFAEQQQILGHVTARLEAEAANPMGYSPRQLKMQTTSINENFANAAKGALSSAAAFAASHGGADTGSGAVGQIAGSIGSAVSSSKAQALSSLGQQDEALKQENRWKAISGLSQVGAEYGGAGGTAIGGSNAAGGVAVDAGSGVLAAQNADWQHTMGMISGIGGLALSATGLGSNIAGGKNAFGGTG